MSSDRVSDMNFSILFLLVAVITDAVQVTIVTVCQGESKAIYCQAQSGYNSTFVRFNYQKVKEKKGKYHFLENGTLFVENVDGGDEGTYGYYCNYGMKCNVMCKVILKLKNNCEVQRVPKGSTIKMTCKVTTPKSKIKEISWTKKALPKSIKLGTNNMTTSQSKHVFSERLQIVWDTLNITNAINADGGSYFCAASTKKRDLFKTYKTYYSIRVIIVNLTDTSRATTTMTTASMQTTTPSLPPSTTTVRTDNSTDNNAADQSVVVEARKSGSRNASGTWAEFYLLIISCVLPRWFMIPSVNSL